MRPENAPETNIEGTQKFSLRLIDQYWIFGSREPAGEPDDATSHGKVSLVINGEEISGCENPDTDYGINQTAVALLQTIFIDHAPQKYETGKPYNPLFFHGCSILGTCPNCIIDFRVEHLPDWTILLDSFRVSGGPLSADPMRFQSETVIIHALDYARQVTAFAEQALSLLQPGKGLDFEVDYYETLRNEHVKLLGMAHEYLKTGRMTPEMIREASSFSVDGCQKL